MSRLEVTGKKFLTFPQLCERWGNCSHMFLERLLRSDPDFPAVYRFGPSGRVRFVDVDDVERYERTSVTDRSSAKKTPAPSARRAGPETHQSLLIAPHYAADATRATPSISGGRDVDEQ